MSDYCNVKFCNLKITKEQAVKIIEEYGKAYEEINIDEILERIGLEYDMFSPTSLDSDLIVPTIRWRIL